jgi:hypothetical protein
MHATLVGMSVDVDDDCDDNYHYYVRLSVLTAASMKIAVFWDVAPCSLVEVYRSSRGACRLHL